MPSICLQHARDGSLHLGWPDADLYLTYVLFLQQQHGQTGLAYAAADGLRHPRGQQILVPVILQAILVTGDG